MLEALGIDTPVVEYGTKIGGGQRQSNGIVRAIITRSQLLVLHETTNSIDSETEAYISEALQNLESRLTLIPIAYRLSTEMHSVIEVFTDHGKVLNVGSFKETSKKTPNFDNQAKLMELNYLNQFSKCRVISTLTYRNNECVMLQE